MEEMGGEGFFAVFHPEDLALFRQTWESAFASGEKFEGEWRVRRADGEYRWFLVRSTPQESAEGQITRWYGTHIEIEERHRAEQALIQAQSEVAHLSRTLGMGELAASIMHEVSQPITAVVTHSYACREWLHSQPANLEKASATAEKIVQESVRASAVVARVRALFQKEPPLKERLDINQMIQNVVRLLRDEAIRRDVLMHVDLGGNLPQVEADRVQIEQVLVNLAINGMDAMSEIDGARELLISSKCFDPQEILVSVEDCGAGLEPETAAKIFDPVLHDKASRHRHGARDQPVDHRSARRTVMGDPASVRRGGFPVYNSGANMSGPFEKQSSTVYVVDDDESIREAISNLLESVGIRSEHFASTEEFLRSGRTGASGLPGARCALAGNDRGRVPAGTDPPQHSHADHFHDRAWRHSHGPQGDEGRRDRIPDQAVSKRGIAERDPTGI